MVQIRQQLCALQVANFSSRKQTIHHGQYLAVADLRLNDDDHHHNDYSLLTSYASILECPQIINSSYSTSSQALSQYDHPSLHLYEENQQQSFSPDCQQLNENCELKFYNVLCNCDACRSLYFLSLNRHRSLASNFRSLGSLIVQEDKKSLSFSSAIFSINTNDKFMYNTLLDDSNNDFLSQFDISDTDIDNHQMSVLQNLLLKYSDCFRPMPGRTPLVEHHIDTVDTKPIKLRPYRVSPQHRSIISSDIAKMLAADIVEPSNSPYVAPITLQPKKDGSLRFCVDFREVNAVTVRDVYLIPRIDDTLDQLRFSKYFTSLDLQSGFWQIALDPRTRHKTAFISHEGLFQFKVMPFGLTNAPATFQRLMDLVLGRLKWSCCLVYLDDIIIYSRNFAEHMNHLELVLQKIKASGLTLQLNKCNFCKIKLKYLGHIVSQNGIMPDPTKIEVVRDYPIPTDLRSVRTFLGLTGYYRRFIYNYATIAEPLIEMTRNSTRKVFSRTAACQQSFEHLCNLLICSPILAYPDFEKPFLLQLDASLVGVSAILAQKQTDSDNVVREHAIAYASRTLNATERKYSTIELECLAIVWGLKHYRPYLEGPQFSMVTDHRALQWLLNTKDNNCRLAR